MIPLGCSHLNGINTDCESFFFATVNLKNKVICFESSLLENLYKQSIELSGSMPTGGALPGKQDGGSMELDVGSTFSESSIFSAQPSQFMWNLVTRGFEARIFL